MVFARHRLILLIGARPLQCIRAQKAWKTQLTILPSGSFLGPVHPRHFKTHLYPVIPYGSGLGVRCSITPYRNFETSPPQSPHLALLFRAGTAPEIPEERAAKRCRTSSPTRLSTWNTGAVIFIGFLATSNDHQGKANHTFLEGFKAKWRVGGDHKVSYVGARSWWLLSNINGWNGCTLLHCYTMHRLLFQTAHLKSSVKWNYVLILGVIVFHGHTADHADSVSSSLLGRWSACGCLWWINLGHDPHSATPVLAPMKLIHSSHLSYIWCLPYGPQFMRWNERIQY